MNGSSIKPMRTTLAFLKTKFILLQGHSSKLSCSFVLTSSSLAPPTLVYHVFSSIPSQGVPSVSGCHLLYPNNNLLHGQHGFDPFAPTLALYFDKVRFANAFEEFPSSLTCPISSIVCVAGSQRLFFCQYVDIERLLKASVQP